MLDNRIKFRHLQCFVEVVRKNSFSRAAQALALTQPAVSKKLKELEQILNVRLLARGRNGVELTAAGHVFLKYADVSLSALREGTYSLVQAQIKGQSRIAVGVLPTVAARVLPEAVRRFRQGGMAVSLNLVSGANPYLLDQLRMGELDVVVGRLAEPDMVTGLSFRHLYSERITFVVRAGHPLLAVSPFSARQIGDYHLLFPGCDSIIARAAERFLISRGIGLLSDRIETISASFGKEYTLQSDAVWIISYGVVARQIAEGQLVELPLDTKETLGAVGLTSRADAPLSPAVQFFIDCVRQVAESLAE